MFPVVKVRTMAIVITATSAVRCLPSGLHTRSLGAGHADLRRAPQPAPLLGWTSRDAKGHLPLHCFFSMGFYNLDEIRMDSQGSELKARLVSVPIREPDGGHHPTTVGLSDAPPPPPPAEVQVSVLGSRPLAAPRQRAKPHLLGSLLFTL